MNTPIHPVAACGLYCGACNKYKNGKCPGCRNNEKASWCGIRKCCIERGYTSCAECTDFSNLKACKKFNNLPGKVIGFLTGSSRFTCIDRIREVGIQNFASEMDSKGLQSLKRK